MKERIELLLQIQNMSPSQFADEIGVQRSVVSHVLSGRNNPSLEFVTKTLLRFQEIRPEWMLFGSGSMMKMASDRTPIIEEPQIIAERNLFSEESSPEPTRLKASDAVSDVESPVSRLATEESEIPPANTRQPLSNKEPSNTGKPLVALENSLLNPSVRKIEKIILFYDDSSFEEFVSGN